MVPMAIGESPAEVALRIGTTRAIFPSLPEDGDGWQAASFLVGSPEDITSALLAWEAAGVQRVLLQMLDQDDIPALELFARTVLPSLG
jgi:alkanesulfonate monooxygenase SsuD/methylene tetrahydromethanopterin reductase-like flavin-dependent oxidoreductase (luciferase family)